ncbi:MAG: hypothetical protein DRI80_11585 [Chloroflexota bacterium]|nr:MAG: hypothetical protein DRI80_11585 [Chloroflexota bacterium]
MRWLIARYQPVSLFSLKHGEATSTGAKTLLVPTPFAIRTALLDAAIRVRGVAYGSQAFIRIQALYVALCPPRRAVVTNLFAKILKPERNPEERGRAMQRTIAFREYVHLGGELALALGGAPEDLEAVKPLLFHVSYFGKRGGFFQLLAPPETVEMEGESAPEGFVTLSGPVITGGQIRGTLPAAFPLGHIQRLDEWGPDLTFERINIYSKEKIRRDRDRIRLDVVLPYRATRSGRGFTLYERID